MKHKFLLLFFVLIPTLLLSQTFRVRVNRVVDGDTFTALNRDNLELKFRIYGIDAPEKSQAFSNKAKQELSKMVMGRTVVVEVLYSDPWGRYVAKVSTQSIKDVGALMLSRGMAWHYKKYDNSALYARLESEAKAARAGLWHDRAPTPPWLWRKR